MKNKVEYKAIIQLCVILAVIGGLLAWWTIDIIKIQKERDTARLERSN
jgi:hypothetical protein